MDGEDAKGFAVEVDAVVVGVDAADAGAVSKAEGGGRKAERTRVGRPLSAFRFASRSQRFEDRWNEGVTMTCSELMNSVLGKQASAKR